MASITSLGVGSGLDLNTLLTKLSAAESKPLDLLKNKQAAYRAKVSAYGNVKACWPPSGRPPRSWRTRPPSA